MTHIAVSVEGTSDQNGDLIPHRFSVWGRALTVEALVDRWYGEEYGYFKVRASDGAVYILRHNRAHGTWELTMFSKLPL